MKEIICAGFGGQGVLTCGLILSDIAVKNDNNATWIPSYGNAMRGGTANCTIKYGEGYIYNPSMEKADALLAMNQLSLKAFGGMTKEDAMIFVSELVDTSDFDGGKRKIYKIPCYKIADELKHERGANIVMTGAILNAMGDFSLEQGLECMKAMFGKKGKAKFEELNANAMRSGYEFVNKIN